MSNTSRYIASSSLVRSVFFVAAAALTGVLLAGVGHHADREYGSAWAAAELTQPTQYVTITAKRLPAA